jgi:predicted chitinase
MLLSDLFEGDDKLAIETIRKVKGGYRLVSKSGKNLGTYPSKGDAENREKQVQYFKHANESERMHLDFDKLYGKAFKIVDAEGDPNKPGFSIVTPSNTNAWTDWKEKPQFKNIVKQRLNDPNFLGDHKYLQIIDAMSQLSEGPIWDKVKKTAAAGAVAGAAGYGALTGQFGDKAKEPARAPIEITIPGGDLEQQKPAVKKEKEKLTPSTATNADPKMEQLVFVTALRSGIKGKELAQFMAQVAHETLGFQRLVEVGSKEYFNRYDPEHNPKKAKILGNVKKGDGLRYKGRGFIQITGRDNYNRAGQALGIDLVNNPKLASTPDVAAKIAVWYWKSRVKPAVDDYTDTIGVTSKVNPSMNGLGDRDMNFHHYLQRLQLED